MIWDRWVFAAERDLLEFVRGQLDRYGATPERLMAYLADHEQQAMPDQLNILNFGDWLKQPAIDAAVEAPSRPKNNPLVLDGDFDLEVTPWAPVVGSSPVIRAELGALLQSGWVFKGLGNAATLILVNPSSKTIAFGGGELRREMPNDKNPLKTALDRAMVTVHRLKPLYSSRQSRRHKSEPQRVSSLTMQDRYLGEEANGVKYFTPEDALQYRAVIRDGRIFLKDGLTPVDSSAARSQHSGYGAMTMVVDVEDNLYLCPHESIEGRRIQHSSFTRGVGVAFAGEAFLHDGYLLGATDKSGHFLPGFPCSVWFLEWAKNKGVDTSSLFYLMVEGRGVEVE